MPDSEPPTANGSPKQSSELVPPRKEDLPADSSLPGLAEDLKARAEKAEKKNTRRAYLARNQDNDSTAEIIEAYRD